ncbi:NB-ARC domain-containing protein [Planobispora longispora]|uniref:NB-ARC domain-containing protein n=1 Tax=Planobispora longispora TaxID=28887 RepID=UPI0019447B3E|nr:NB-ARC domain-containing protein [Planobispora longispora]
MLVLIPLAVSRLLESRGLAGSLAVALLADVGVVLAARAYLDRRGKPAESEAVRPGGREYVVPRSLPPAPQVFVGREETVADLEARLREAGRVPLLVLHGAGGIGKTALALVIAHRLAGAHPDGQIYVQVGDFQTDGMSAEQIRHEIAGAYVYALKRPDDELPTATGGRIDFFHRRSAGRSLLILLDDVPADMDLAGLLPDRPGCTTIITSRRIPGGLPGAAVTYEPPPLAEDDSVKLLSTLLGADRVESDPADPDDLTAVAARRLADACGGQPLALRLAAAALSQRPHWDLRFAVEAILQRRPDPEQLDVSYMLLTAQERLALRSIGSIGKQAFTGWMLAAAASSPGEPVSEELADRLARAQFVERRGTRRDHASFYVEDEVLEYARRLAEREDGPQASSAREESVTRAREDRRGRDPALSVREQVYPLMRTGDLSAALATAQQALDLADEQGDGVAAGAACAALAEIFSELGDTLEAEEAAQRAIGTGHPGNTARALRCNGRIHRRLRELDKARAFLDEALGNAERAGDAGEQARVLFERAYVLSLQGDVTAARGDLDRADRLRTSGVIGAETMEPTALWYRGAVLYVEGRLGDSAEEFGRARASSRRLGQRLWEAWTEHVIAKVALATDRLDDAKEAAEAGLELFTAIRNRYGAAHCRYLLGQAHLVEGAVREAEIELWETAETFRACGDVWVERHARALARAAAAWARAEGHGPGAGAGEESVRELREEIARELGEAAEIFRASGDVWAEGLVARLLAAMTGPADG